MANPGGLRNAISILKNDSKLREKNGNNAFKTYESHASPGSVGETLLNSLYDLF